MKRIHNLNTETITNSENEESNNSEFKKRKIEVSRSLTEGINTTYSTESSSDENIELLNRELTITSETYGYDSQNPFSVKDTFTLILNNLFVKKTFSNNPCLAEDIKSIRLVSQLLRYMIDTSNRISLKLKAADLCSLRLSTLVKNYLVRIQIGAFDDLQDLIDFIKDPSKEHLLDYLKAIDFYFVDRNNIKQTQEILNLLSQKANQLPNLRTISFRAFGDLLKTRLTLQITKLPESVTSLSFGDLLLHATLKILDLPTKLLSISFGDLLDSNLIIEKFSDNLSSFSMGNIFDSTLTISKISSCKHLSTFKCGTIRPNATLSVTDSSGNRLTSPAEVQQFFENLKAEVDERNLTLADNTNNINKTILHS